ncbi:MAG: DUF4240 domain-containing protein [Sphingomonas sp.]
MTKLILFGLGIAAIAVLALIALRGANAEVRTTDQRPAGIRDQTGSLDEHAFWALIDQSAAGATSQERQIAALRAGLLHLSAEQIAEFQHQFDTAMRASYSWDLWGAAYLVNGGASDDGFDYFRCWLISRGRATFETVTADPDALATLLPPDSGDDLEFEELAYVARAAWAEKTGQSPDRMPIVATAPTTEPTGTPFSENPAELAKRYPRLWERFGER